MKSFQNLKQLTYLTSFILLVGAAVFSGWFNQNALEETPPLESELVDAGPYIFLRELQDVWGQIKPEEIPVFSPDLEKRLFTGDLKWPVSTSGMMFVFGITLLAAPSVAGFIRKRLNSLHPRRES